MPSAGGSILHMLIAPAPGLRANPISSVERLSNDPSVRDVSPSTDGGKGMLYTNKATAPASIAHGCHLRREFHSFFKAGATTTIWWPPPQRLPFSDVRAAFEEQPGSHHHRLLLPGMMAF
ncbi:hypothetical protein B0H14DRAFT_3521471 [Mycena olivaceomarginata]|nr:hypothetical protein B0H14DRAFT_3521471 [Mycena olivaceomarginata]